MRLAPNLIKDSAHIQVARISSMERKDKQRHFAQNAIETFAIHAKFHGTSENLAKRHKKIYIRVGQ